MSFSVGRQVALIVVVFTLAAAAAISYSARLTYDAHVGQLQTESSSMAATVVAYVNQYLTAADAVAITAARHPLVSALDPGAVSVLRPLLGGRPQLLNNILLADTGGEVRVWAEPPEAELQGEIDAAWLREVASSRRPATSRMLGGPGAGMHFLVLAYPVPGVDGATAGVLGLVVHLEQLEAVLASIPLPAGSVVTLTDAKSVVVARSLDAHEFVGRSTEAPGQSRDPFDVPATVVRSGVDGIERAFGNAVVARGPWLASVGIPTSVAWARTVPIYRRNIAMSITVALVLLALIGVILRRWQSAFDYFDHAARRVTLGDLSPVPARPMPSAEMARLQESLVGMVTSLRGAREDAAAQMNEERRMREELQSLQQQVIRQERLAAIGVLVSGVAHELNNPLQAILGFAELLQMQPGIPEQAKDHLVLIQKESARASAIIRNLSRFGRQTSELSPVRLRDVVASVLELRQRKLEENGVRVETEEHSRNVVMAIFTELQQVALNFAINAEQALQQPGVTKRRLVIRTGDRDGWAWLEVEDSGLGVRPGDETKLFQPFYTTKPVGEGTGLGLSVSYDIIRAHGGRIGHRPAPGGGAIFFFELPGEGLDTDS